MAIDAIVLLVSAAATEVIFRPSPAVPDGVPQVSVSAGLVVAWLAMLALRRTRSRHVVGLGAAEYARTWTASVQVVLTTAVVGQLVGWHLEAEYLVAVGLLGAVLLTLGRYANRQWLRRRRSLGQGKSWAIAVGEPKEIERLIRELQDDPRSEFLVVGACLPADDCDGRKALCGVPVLGQASAVAEVVESVKAHAVIVVSPDLTESRAVRRLIWDLEGRGVEIVLTAGVLDVAGRRITVRPSDAVPFLHLCEARYSGPSYVAKAAFDWIVGLLVTLMLSPVLVVVALAVRVTSPGPVFFVQQRVGRDGRLFNMIKFRSMVVGADREMGSVLASEGQSAMTLFYKPKNDPRVTPLGRFIRKYSLDELPQLFNVLRGEMSLVGPRPQIPEEAVLYDSAARRRLRVKPGLTGLWQVSGRSTLTASQAIRLDLRYAENRSLFGDLAIIARTVKVVLRGDGAW